MFVLVIEYSVFDFLLNVGLFTYKRRLKTYNADIVTTPSQLYVLKLTHIYRFLTCDSLPISFNLTCFFHCNRSPCVCCNHYFSSRISVCWILKLTHPSFLGLFTIFFRTVFLFDMTFLTFFIVFQIRFPVFLLLTKIALIDMSNLSGTVLVILSILSVSCYNI